MDPNVCKVDSPKKDELEFNGKVGFSPLKRRYSDYDDSYEESKAVVKFSPPAYVQRYQAVKHILTDPKYGGKLKKIVDFGCSELGFFNYLKNITGVEELLFVDIDRSILESYKEKAKPLNVDYLHQRDSPLLLKILEGNVTDSDNVLENCDAVVCIELVEHMYLESLNKLPYNIFGFIRPKVAIITTPNAEFNVLFKNMSMFRHPDHKFEWTRMQFEDWANNIVSRFPEYSVSFHGIGDGPPGTEDLGTCTQMAVFHKTQDLQLVKESGVEGLFKTVVVYDYPFKVDNRSDEEKILDDAVYFIRKFSFNQEEITEEIPLKQLLDVMSNFYISLNDFKKILEHGNWTVIDREDGPVVLVPPLSPFSNHSIESEFSNHNTMENEEWDQESEIDFVYPNHNSDMGLDDSNWDSIPCVQSEYRNTANSNFHTNVANITVGTPSIYANDAIERQLVLDNSKLRESILITSCSETKDSKNLENSEDCCLQLQTSLTNTDSKITEASTSFFSTQSLEENKLKNLEGDSVIFPIGENSSMCSIFIEPSNMSEDVNIESLYPLFESNATSPSVNEIYKSFRFSNSISPNNVNENTFEEPKYTSSPHALSLVSTKNKNSKQDSEYFHSDSTSKRSKNLISINNKSKNKFKKIDSTLINSCTYHINSTIEKNNHSEYLFEKNDIENTEETRSCIGTAQKKFDKKILVTSMDAERETKLEVFSDISENLSNSCPPEIIDSGYSNTNSLPNSLPKHDLTSTAHDCILDLDYSITNGSNYDIGYEEAKNRDLTNNNLDDKRNNK